MTRAAAPSARRARAVESFQSAAATIGPVTPGMSLFAITRGQFSMIDAILHVLDEVGPSRVSFWTWTVAEYEVQVVERLIADKRITSGRMVIDHGARNKNAELIRRFQQSFGADSVRYVVNHAKIATIETVVGDRYLLRGSMNLNFNPRFEQFDLTSNGPDFDLIREVEDELPILEDDCSGKDVYAATKLHEAFSTEQLQLFPTTKRWAK